MDFSCVGTNPKGQYYMKYHKPFTFAERIQLLERSILVNSFAYYILNDNILSDFQYDDNARELAELKKEHPEDFKRSRYYEYFKDYCSDDDNTVFTSGFDLLEKVRKADYDLYSRLHEDASMALKLKYNMKEKGDVYV